MKDILLFDDPQKDEFIEIFKTPPILSISTVSISSAVSVTMPTCAISTRVSALAKEEGPR